MSLRTRLTHYTQAVSHTLLRLTDFPPVTPHVARIHLLLSIAVIVVLCYVHLLVQELAFRLLVFISATIIPVDP